MTSPKSPLFFSDYVLDMAVRELRHGDTPVPLQPRVLDLLEFLIANRERAVDKDAISEAVWGGRIVSETALTRAIMKARRAIGDSAETQELIRTIHGHGYQFVGEIRGAATPTVEASDAPAAAIPTQVDSGRSRITSAGLMAGALACVVLAAYMLWPQPPPSAALRLAVMPIHDATDDPDLAWVGLGLMGFANDLLNTAAQLDLVAAGDVVRYTESAKWNGRLDDKSTLSHVTELARRYGASHVLLSELTRNAGGLRLSYALFDDSGQLDNGTMVNDQSTELIKGMVRGVTVALTPRRHVPNPQISIAEDPFIDEAYARGRSLAIEGRCAEALPLFDVVTASAGDLQQVTLQRAACARILGRWQEAEEALTALLDALGTTSPPGARAHVSAGLATVFHRTGRQDDAAKMYAAGLALAREAGDRVAEGKLLIGRAILQKDLRNFDAAREDLARASLAYRDAGYDVLPGQIYSTLANAAMNDGKLDQAEEHIRLALESYRELGDRRHEAMMLNNLGYLRRVQGRMAEAEPLHLKSLDIRREIGDRVGQGRILGMLSIIYNQQSRFSDARDAASEAVSIAREANDALFIATGLSQLADVHSRLGEYDAAREAYREAGELFAALNDTARVAQVDLQLAGVDLDAGNIDDAARQIAEVSARADAQELHEPAVEALVMMGKLERRRDRPASAIALYTDALRRIAETGFATGHVRSINIKLANLYLDADDADAAEPLLGAALEEDMDMPVIRLQARFAYARGDASRAAKILQDAQASAIATWTDADTATLDDYLQQAVAAIKN